MKIIIAVVILLNVYGVLSSTHERDEHKKHHHKHHNGNAVNEITVDELADVLVSLPGSMGRQAYKIFLSLGKYLPVETKAHKFFTAIPKAIRKKSKGEISELRGIPRSQPSTLSSNPIFMVQPDGYHMMPLPLHPMFSSSPLDFLTRVPCAHTKVIRVPLHTFDVKISSITRRFGPAQNSFDDLQESDNDEDNYYNNASEDENELNKLLDLIASSDSDNEGEEDLQSPKQNEDELEEPKVEEDKVKNPSKEEEVADPKLKEEEVKEPPKEEEKEEVVEPKVEEDEVKNPSKEEEDADPKLKEEEVNQPPKEEEKEVEKPKVEDEVIESPKQEEEEEVVQPSIPEEEITELKQELEKEKEVQEEQSEEVPPPETPQRKKPKKGEGKKGKKVQKEQNTNSPTEDVIKPVPGRKGRKKKANTQSE